jgi:hypothetical protein
MKNNNVDKIRLSWFRSRSKYSYIELICNWAIVINFIVFLIYYVVILCVYWTPLMNFVQKKIVFFPLPAWSMIILAVLFFTQIIILVVKLSMRHKRRNYKRYVTIDEYWKQKYDPKTKISTAKFSNSTKNSSFWNKIVDFFKSKPDGNSGTF